MLLFQGTLKISLMTSSSSARIETIKQMAIIQPTHQVFLSIDIDNVDQGWKADHDNVPAFFKSVQKLVKTKKIEKESKG